MILTKHIRWTVQLCYYDKFKWFKKINVVFGVWYLLELGPFGNYIHVFDLIWNAFEDALFQLIVYAWKMYGMQTLHAGRIAMFQGTYISSLTHSTVQAIVAIVTFLAKI